MGDLLRNSFEFAVKCNAFAFQNGLYVPSNYGSRNRGLYGSCGNYAITMSTTLFRIAELNVVPVLMKGHSFLGCVGLDLSRTNMLFGSPQVLAAPNAVSFYESGLVSKENELVQSGSHGLDDEFSHKSLSPWGILEVHRVLDCETEIIEHPSCVPKTGPFMDESKRHFLEETDEDELSRRLLVLSRSNRVRSALELFKSMEFSSLKPNGHACNSLISCLLRNKRHCDAMRVFEFMERKEITTGHTYSLILKSVADTKGCDSALNMFARIEGNARKKHFDVIVYNTMISICGRVNNWFETERIWKLMKEFGLHGTQVTYSLLVSIFIRCVQNELALDAYNEMIQHGLKPKDDTMQAIIGACTKEAKWEFALIVFKNMLNHGLKPNLVSCNALINSLGKAGEIKLAFKVFEIMKTMGHTPDEYSWNALLSGLYRANQHIDALKLFEEIKKEQKPQLNEHIYNTSLMSCQKLGLWDRALQILWQFEASGKFVPTASYNLVIGTCEVARKPKVALEVYEHMVHKGCVADTFTYLSLIRSCIWASMWSEVQDILNVAPDVSVYNAVIHGMCLRGKVESAKKLYLKMRESGIKPDGKTRALMLQNLRKKSTRRRRRMFSRHR